MAKDSNSPAGARHACHQDHCDLQLRRGGTFGSAIEALRHGVIDFIATPVEPADFAARIDSALIVARRSAARDRAVPQESLPGTQHARHEISPGGFALQRPVNAYQEIAEQMNEVAMASEFRTLRARNLMLNLPAPRWSTSSPRAVHERTQCFA
jgi:hypothetical protein